MSMGPAECQSLKRAGRAVCPSGCVSTVHKLSDPGHINGALTNHTGFVHYARLQTGRERPCRPTTMPTNYTDQFYSFDPANPPPVGTAVSFSQMTLTDSNDDGDLDRFNGDSVDGVDILRSYPGDTVTINVPGVGNVTYTGTTFYMQDGSRIFTPTDGQVLQDGTFVSSTWVTVQGPLLVGDLGPPCFTPGTLIRVPDGAVPVETLKVGDKVETLDHGPQTLRWIGQTEVDGSDELAPVAIAAGALGNERDLLVSSEHRMLITGWEAELHFAEEEVLVAAKHLVGLEGITYRPMTRVKYLHLLFDRHEIVFAEGAPSESLYPSSWMIAGDRALRAEIEAVFPDLMDRLDGPPVPAARRVVSRREAFLIAA